MSFQFMPLYTGDYSRDTRHLTPEEHGVYILLLMHCWDQKGPVPLDERRQCGLVNARSGGEIESLRRVLMEFFTRMEDGWYNKRMAEEITKSEMISAHRRAGGLEKARRDRDALRHAQAVLKQSKSTAPAGTPTPTPTPTPTTSVELIRTVVGTDATASATNQPRSPKKREPKIAALRLDAPTEQHRQIARERGVDCDVEFAAYRDWLSANGRVHKDEVAGFRNWLRRAVPNRAEVAARRTSTMDILTGRAHGAARPMGAKTVRSIGSPVWEQDEGDVG